MKKYLIRFIIGLLAVAGVVLSVYIFIVTILKAEPIILPTSLSSLSAYPSVQFEKAHKVSVNGLQKAIWTSYQFTSADFVEGVNTISIQRVSKFGIGGFAQDYTVNVDRVSPVLKINSNIPTEVVRQGNIDIYLSPEAGSSLYLNDAIIRPENSKIILPLKKGLNTGKLYTVDGYRNVSKIVNYSITNVDNENYVQQKCGKFTYIIDKSKLQVGYSGVKNRPEINNEASKDFAFYNTPRCQVSDTNVVIFPLKTEASCWKCDELSSYISISNNQKVSNRPPVESQSQYPNIVKAQEYVTKSGIVGDLVKKTSAAKGSTQVSQTFEYVIEDTVYEVSGEIDIDDPNYTRFDQDFMFFIDHIYLTDRSIPQTNDHTVSTDLGMFTVDKFSGLRFQYKPDWKISYTLGNDTQSQNSAAKKVIAQKGPYNVTIVQSPKDKGGVCVSPYDAKNVGNYEERFIDGKKLQVPLITKVKLIKATGVDGKVVIIEQDQYGAIVANCLIKAGNFEYTITVGGYEIGKPANDFDLLIEKEIINLINTIKWF